MAAHLATNRTYDDIRSRLKVIGKRTALQQHRHDVVFRLQFQNDVQTEHRRPGCRSLVADNEHRVPTGIQTIEVSGVYKWRRTAETPFGLAKGDKVFVGISRKIIAHVRVQHEIERFVEWQPFRIEIGGLLGRRDLSQLWRGFRDCSKGYTVILPRWKRSLATLRD